MRYAITCYIRINKHFYYTYNVHSWSKLVFFTQNIHVTTVAMEKMLPYFSHPSDSSIRALQPPLLLHFTISQHKNKDPVYLISAILICYCTLLQLDKYSEILFINFMLIIPCIVNQFQNIPTRWHCTVLYYFLSVALHVSGISHAHHQELN
jgi:hypothetical protein